MTSGGSSAEETDSALFVYDSSGSLLHGQSADIVNRLRNMSEPMLIHQVRATSSIIIVFIIITIM